MTIVPCNDLSLLSLHEFPLNVSMYHIISLLLSQSPVMQMTADTNVLSGFHVFVIVSAALLLICSLCGYSVYLLYMRRDEANKARLLNVLYANIAVCFMTDGVLRFARILQFLLLSSADTIVPCLLVRGRQFLDLFTVLLFLQISVVTSINHYNPSLYLELSLKGRRLTVLCLQALPVALLLGAVELFSGSGGLCASKEVEQKILGFAFPLLILNLLLQLGVVVDTCWGWSKLRKTMMSLVTRKTNSVHPASNMELGDGDHQTESEDTMDHIGSIPADKVVVLNVSKMDDLILQQSLNNFCKIVSIFIIHF